MHITNKEGLEGGIVVQSRYCLGVELEIFIIFGLFEEDYINKPIVIPSNNYHFFLDSSNGCE